MTSRRQMLAGLTIVGAASLAGCSVLSGSNDDREREVTVPADAVPRFDRPASPFPVDIPAELAERHVRCGRELLSAVPVDPDIPNGAVATKLADRRQDVENDLASEPGDAWSLDRLASRRYDRGEAAAVTAAYRAATGEGEFERLAKRRHQVQTRIGPIVADTRYRGADAIEAVLVHATIEDLVATGRRLTHKYTDYPRNPVAEPFNAGEAVQGVERAAAAIDDAAGLRQHYLEAATGVEPRDQTLSRASEQLDDAVRDARDAVGAFLDVDDSPFDRDLEGTAASWLFDIASGRAEYLTEAFDDHRKNGDLASAVRTGTEALATIETLRTIVDGIHDGAYVDETTVETVRATGQRARDNLAAAADHRRPGLAVAVAESGIRRYEDAFREVRSEYHRDGHRIRAALAWVELYAQAAAAAATFLIEQMDAV